MGGRFPPLGQISRDIVLKWVLVDFAKTSDDITQPGYEPATGQPPFLGTCGHFRSRV